MDDVEKICTKLIKSNELILYLV